jgi:hypothetical protein
MTGTLACTRTATGLHGHQHQQLAATGSTAAATRMRTGTAAGQQVAACTTTAAAAAAAGGAGVMLAAAAAAGNASAADGDSGLLNGGSRAAVSVAVHCSPQDGAALAGGRPVSGSFGSRRLILSLGT